MTYIGVVEYTRLYYLGKASRPNSSIEFERMRLKHTYETVVVSKESISQSSSILKGLGINNSNTVMDHSEGTKEAKKRALSQQELSVQEQQYLHGQQSQQQLSLIQL